MSGRLGWVMLRSGEAAGARGALRCSPGPAGTVAWLRGLATALRPPHRLPAWGLGRLLPWAQPGWPLCRGRDKPHGKGSGVQRAHPNLPVVPDPEAHLYSVAMTAGFTGCCGATPPMWHRAARCRWQKAACVGGPCSPCDPDLCPEGEESPPLSFPGLGTVRGAPPVGLGLCPSPSWLAGSSGEPRAGGLYVPFPGKQAKGQGGRQPAKATGLWGPWRGARQHSSVASPCGGRGGSWLLGSLRQLGTLGGNGEGKSGANWPTSVFPLC